jgi:predicted metal-dependent phosphoesterase TrpH
MEAGLDGICVTEHNTMSGGEIAEELGREIGFLVIAGQEVATREGDILAFGVERECLNGIHLAELGRIAGETGGVLIPAHPFRTQALSIGDKIYEYGPLFAAVEGMNGNLGESGNRMAQEAAARLGLPCTGGSDAHSKEMVAKFCTEFERASSLQIVKASSRR